MNSEHIASFILLLLKGDPKMKTNKTLLFITSVFFILLLTSSVFTETEESELKIINETDFDITSVYLAVELSDSWAMLELDGQKLKAGDSTYVNFDLRGECYWDAKAIDVNKNEYLFYGIELCEDNVIYIYVQEGFDEEEEEEEEN